MATHLFPELLRGQYTKIEIPDMAYRHVARQSIEAAQIILSEIEHFQ